MPFTWEQNGVEFSANPIKFEMARANAIRLIWQSLLAHVTEKYCDVDPDTAEKEIRSNVIPHWGKVWRKANNITFKGQEYDGPTGERHWYFFNIRGGHELDIPEYDQKTISFGNKFRDFLDKFKAGKVSDNDNNMVGVAKVAFQKEYGENAWYVGSKSKSLLEENAAFGDVGVNVENLIASVKNKPKKESIKDEDKALVEVNRDATKMTTFNNVIGWIGLGEAAADKRRLKNELEKWNERKFFGFEFGDIKKMMFNDGVQQMFRVSQFASPITTANTLLQILMDNKIFPKDYRFIPNDLQSPIFSFAKQIFDILGMHQALRGASKEEKFKLLSTDLTSQAGFAQSLLEYFGLRVIPSWDKVQSLLSYVMAHLTDPSGKTKTKELDAAMRDFLQLFQPDFMLKDISLKLRFPSMKIRVIDYHNAKGKQI